MQPQEPKGVYDYIDENNLRSSYVNTNTKEKDYENLRRSQDSPVIQPNVTQSNLNTREPAPSEHSVLNLRKGISSRLILLIIGALTGVVFTCAGIGIGYAVFGPGAECNGQFLTGIYFCYYSYFIIFNLLYFINFFNRVA